VNSFSRIRAQRLVLNVWFARSDFTGFLPPTIVSLTNWPGENLERAYIFKNARGFSGKIKDQSVKPTDSIFQKMKKVIKH